MFVLKMLLSLKKYSPSSNSNRIVKTW